MTMAPLAFKGNDQQPGKFLRAVDPAIAEHYLKLLGLPPRLAALPEHRAPVRDLRAWRAMP
jgi:hypothetical protein